MGPFFGATGLHTGIFARWAIKHQGSISIINNFTSTTRALYHCEAAAARVRTELAPPVSALVLPCPHRPRTASARVRPWSAPPGPHPPHPRPAPALQLPPQGPPAWKDVLRVQVYVWMSKVLGITSDNPVLEAFMTKTCFATLDYIVTCFFGHLAKEDKKTLRGRDISQDGQRTLHFMQQNPEVLQQMMSVLMNTIIFGD
ncbi:uncharacterized protein [Chamaea fasciata]|uniref:uncharacterized protein isoform X2 n=1 Tax=Chamaea fasciata TaxID=190680 RepID=UPI00336A34AD